MNKELKILPENVSLLTGVNRLEVLEQIPLLLTNRVLSSCHLGVVKLKNEKLLKNVVYRYVDWGLVLLWKEYIVLFKFLEKETYHVFLHSPTTDFEVKTLFNEFLGDHKGAVTKIKNKRQPGRTSIRTIMSDRSGLYLSDYVVDKTVYNKRCGDLISCHYNDDFAKVHESLVTELNKGGKGLYLLHGLPGTGKTTYLKSISKLVKKRDFIFLPSTFASVIAEPSFLTFLEQKCKGSVIILEDAEEVLKDRSINKTSAVPNILNITDGILGDMLGISVICTYNANTDVIDKALLRKGRAKVNYYFDKLSLEKCKNINNSITEPMTLADALMFEEESLVKERRAIGFGNYANN